MKKIICMLMFLYASSYANGDGWLNLDFGPNGDGYIVGPSGLWASSVKVQADDGIVAGGSSAKGEFQLVRYTSDGCIDTAFGVDGVAQGPQGILFDLMIQPNGYITTSGQDQSGNFLVARFDEEEGNPDLDFGNKGIIQGPAGFCSALIQQIDEYIIAGGGSSDGEFLVIRYTPDGSVDTVFDMGLPGFVEDLALQENGQVVACGADEYTNFKTVRYNSDGSVDTYFGINGVATGPQGVATALVIQPDGYIVVAGFNSNNPYDLDGSYTVLLTRLDPYGQPDFSFGTNGIVVGPNAMVNGLVLQPDGKLVVVGLQESRTFVMRFDNDGTVDDSFGIDGITVMPAGALYGAALQHTGNIIAVGLDRMSTAFLVTSYTNHAPLVKTEFFAPLIASCGYVAFAGTAQNSSNLYFFLNDDFIGGTTTFADGSNLWSYITNIETPGMYTLRVVNSYDAGHVLSADANLLRVCGCTI